MNLFTIIALLIMGFGLFRDFKRDQGMNSKAKIWHTVLLTLFLAVYAGSFAVLGSLIRNFDMIKTQYSVDVGLVPGPIHLALYFLHIVISLILLVLAYQLLSRKESARKWLLIFLPILGGLQVFSFYRGWHSVPNDLVISDLTVVLIGIIIMGGFTLLYLKVYSSRWMKAFFQFKTSSKEIETNSKEELKAQIKDIIDI